MDKKPISSTAAFALGVVIGYKGLRWAYHLGYVSVIIALAAWHLKSIL